MLQGQRALAYIRVSVVGDRAIRGQFESPDLQREAIDRWAAQSGVEVVDEVRDLNRSGGTLTRPGLQQAVAAVRRGEVQGIIVARSDRASRRTIDGLGLIDDLERHGGWIAAVDGTIDTTTRSGRLATTMFFAMGQNELDRYREQSAEVHRKAIVEKGRHMGPAPFGYLRGDDRRLIPDPKRADVVRDIYQRRANGDGWAKIARELEQAGVRRHDGRVLASGVIQRMIPHRVYLGEASHGQWVAVDAHPALVTPVLWAEANRATPAVRSPAPWTGRRHEESLLRGLLRCAGCRYVMKRLPGRGDRPPRWVCRTISSDAGAAHECMSPARLTPSQTPQAERLVIAGMFHLSAQHRVGEQPDDIDAATLDREVDEAEALLDELSSLELRRELGADRWSKMVSEARADRDAKVAGREQKLAGRRAASAAGSLDVRAAWEAIAPDARGVALRSIVQAVMVVAGDAPLAERLHLVPVWDPVEVPRTGGRYNRAVAYVHDAPGAPGLCLQAVAERAAELA